MYIPLPDDGWNKVYSFFLLLLTFFPLSFALVIYLRLLLWMDGQTLTERCKACPPSPSLLSRLCEFQVYRSLFLFLLSISFSLLSLPFVLSFFLSFFRSFFLSDISTFRIQSLFNSEILSPS